jgi:hypothetical protein
VTAAAVAILVLGPALPGHASTDLAGGDMTFSGTATLAKFPCEPPPPFGNGPCTGTFDGEWSGHLSGHAGAGAFDVSWTTVQTAPDDGNRVHSDFDFAEFTCANIETVAGYASGTATADAGSGTVRGSYQVPGELLPRDVTHVSLAAHFTWVRVVNNAVLVFDTFRLVLDVAEYGQVTVVDGQQAGTASFAVAPPGPNLPSCTKPWSPATASVVGDVPLVGGAR